METGWGRVGILPIGQATLSCLVWNFEGSENSKLYLDFQVVIKLHFSREKDCVTICSLD